MRIMRFENCWSQWKDDEDEKEEKEAVGSCGCDGRVYGNLSEQNQAKIGGQRLVCGLGMMELEN
jgi:hypothetical protein